MDTFSHLPEHPHPMNDAHIEYISWASDKLWEKALRQQQRLRGDLQDLWRTQFREHRLVLEMELIMNEIDALIHRLVDLSQELIQEKRYAAHSENVVRLAKDYSQICKDIDEAEVDFRLQKMKLEAEVELLDQLH